MRTIERTFQRRGKQVQLQEVAGLAAVRKSQAGHRSAQVSKLLEGVSPEAAAQLQAYQSEGWEFVPEAPPAQGAKVYIKSGGRVALGTNQLTVKVPEKQSPDEVSKLFDRYGLTVVDRLKWGPNMFVVEVQAGHDPVELAAKLTESGDVVFAEPNLIELIGSR